MRAFMYALAGLLILFGLYVFFTAPSLRKKRMEPWKGQSFAHRGLYGGEIPENSMEAFRRAVEAGYGIELDIRFSKDRKLVVFHDDTLERMTGDPRRVDELTYEELTALSLSPTAKHTIPLFTDVLALIGGRVPLLTEVKHGPGNNALVDAAIEALSAYEGPFLVESFHPGVLVRFRRRAPEISRGQLVSGRAELAVGTSAAASVVLSRLFTNLLSRPDFIAFDIHAKCFPEAVIQSVLFQTPLAGWTVRTREEYDRTAEQDIMPIFEGFAPPPRETVSVSEAET